LWLRNRRIVVKDVVQCSLNMQADILNSQCGCFVRSIHTCCARPWGRGVFFM